MASFSLSDLKKSAPVKAEYAVGHHLNVSDILRIFRTINPLFISSSLFDRKKIGWNKGKGMNEAVGYALRFSLLDWCIRYGYTSSWPSDKRLNEDYAMLSALNSSNQDVRADFIYDNVKEMLIDAKLGEKISDFAVFGGAAAYMGETAGEYMLFNGFADQNQVKTKGYRYENQAFGMSQWLNIRLLEFVLYSETYCMQRFGTTDVPLGLFFSPRFHHAYELECWKKDPYLRGRVIKYVQHCGSGAKRGVLLYKLNSNGVEVACDKATSARYVSDAYGASTGNFITTVQGVYPGSSSFLAQQKANKLIKILY